jgi:hypothetical protein
VLSGVVEVVALLGSVNGGFCRSSAARAVVNKVTAAVDNKPLIGARVEAPGAGRYVRNENSLGVSRVPPGCRTVSYRGEP